MAERHIPVARISGNGTIEVTCSCRKMTAVAGRKDTVERGWNAHLGVYEVRPGDTVRLNLNVFTDPADGPAQMRDLDQFPPDVAKRIRQNDPSQRPWPEPPEEVWFFSIPDDIRLPGSSGNARSSDTRTDRQGQDTSPKARLTMARVVYQAFVTADHEAVRNGRTKLTDKRRRLMVHAAFMLGGAVGVDVFEDELSRQDFARISGIPYGDLQKVEAGIVQLLTESPSARWRFRRMIQIVEEEQGRLELPSIWQQTLDQSPD